MKKILILLATLCLLPGARAGAAAPEFLHYQGLALTATGEVLGKGNPVTSQVTVRVWNHPSNFLPANLLYSEQQTVTIAEGEFSLFIGKGADTAGTPLGFAETGKGPGSVSIRSAVAGTNCYFGITIAAGQEIAPRQQWVSTAYAMRTAHADTITGSITSAMLADGAVTSDKLSDGAIATNDLASGSVNSSAIAAASVTSAKIATGSVNAAAIADGAVTAAKIANGSLGHLQVSGLTPPAPSGMAYIPGGAYTQGNSSTADNDNSHINPVTTTVAPFYMDVNLVTFGKWQAVALWGNANGYTPLYGSGRFPNHPVHSVSWYDMVKWCNARSVQEGLTPVYYTDTAQTTIYTTGNVDITNAMVKWTANGYRLPTEAEWERAARGGLNGQRFPWGNTITTNMANYQGLVAGRSYDLGPQDSSRANRARTPYTSPVGSYPPNGYGLYDMAGNVWQCCWDWYGTTFAPYAGTDPRIDPRGPATGSGPYPYKVLRGGSYYDNVMGCRVETRSSVTPSLNGDSIGFRVVRSSVP